MWQAFRPWVLSLSCLLLFLLFGSSVVQAVPNLAPYTPTDIGWAAPLEVSADPINFQSAVSFSSGQTLYVRFAIANHGTDTTARYYISLRVDSTEVESWFVDPPHQSMTYVALPGSATEPPYELGTLPAGTHTIELVADSTSAINESDEADNRYSSTITVSGQEQLPNLQPYTPQGWPAPLVISKVPGTNQDASSISGTDTLYVDGAFGNVGTVDVTVEYRVAIVLDGTEIGYLDVSPPHQTNTAFYFEDFEVGPLPAGTHTFELVVDSTFTVAETNENDNTYARSITVIGEPNLLPYTPPGWPGPLVVSNVTGTSEDSPTLTASDTIYVDGAFANDGSASTSTEYRVTLLLDGADIAYLDVSPPHESNTYVTFDDFELGTLEPGTHKLRLDVDSESAISESDEQDNSYTREIKVLPSIPQTEILLVFPSVGENTERATGIAIANPTEEVAEVELLLVDDSGDPMVGSQITNPKVLTILPDGQVARTVPELFGNGTKGKEGWVLATSKNLGIVGFFLTFAWDVTKIDGAEAVVPHGSPLVAFPEAFGGAGGFTEVSVLATGSVDLELYRGTDGMVEKKSVVVAPEGVGRYRARLDQIFSTPITADCFVLARSSESAIIGYETFGASGYWGGRNAIPVSEIGRETPLALFGAQLADTPDIESTVTLINPTDTAALLTLSAYRTGVSTPSPAAGKTVTLGPRAILRENARALLSLPAGNFVGWLRVDSNVAGVVGDVTFGDPNGLFLSSVQLQSAPVSDAVFSHVADGLGYLTGLTFLNVSADPAQVTLEVFDLAGNKTGEGSFILAPFEHRPRLLSELVQGLKPQIGGYIRAKSSIRVFMFELFLYLPGGKLTSMAAVPPQRGYGSASGQINPASPSALQSSLAAALEHPALRYRASRAKGILLDIDSDFVPGQVIVRMRPETEPSERRLLVERQGLRILAQGVEGSFLAGTSAIPSQFPLSREAAESPETRLQKQRTLDLVEALNSEPGVLYAEPNGIRRHDRLPSDPALNRQWHYSQINLPAAWDLTTGSSGVVIAVIDTGAKFAHPDLGSRLTGGQYDFISDPQVALDGDGMDPDAEDPGDDPEGLLSSYHGTHVAGTIGAATNNARGVAGVNWVSPLMILRVLGRSGGTDWDISQAILYAARLANASAKIPSKRANVINLSFGGPGYNRTLDEAVQSALGQNVTIVAAAGNQNSTEVHYPADFPGVLKVGAIDVSGGRAPYSNYGPRLDVVAPGGNTSEDRDGDGYVDGVLSTLWKQSSDEPNYVFYQGTSMAAPHVAGLASLILSLNPALSPTQVRQILTSTAIDLGVTGKDDEYGFGLIDPVSALRAAGAPSTPTPVLVLSTDRMDFGYGQTDQTAVVSNGGGGQLTVNSPSVQTGQGSGWLTATLSGSTITVSVNRTGLSEGHYTGSVLVTSNGGNGQIAVSMDVGTAPANDVGDVYVLALDPLTLNTAATASTDANWTYLYALPPVAAGGYVVAGGTDLDEDGFICDEGEFCGIYPVRNQPSLVSVEPNIVTGDIDFTIEKGELASGADLAAVRGASGFRRTLPGHNALEIELRRILQAVRPMPAP